LLVSGNSTSPAPAVLATAIMAALLPSSIWGWQRAFEGASALVGVLYLGVCMLSQARRGESAAELGLRFDNLPRALGSAAVFVVPAVLVLVAAGFALESLQFSWSRAARDIPWLLVWGTAQQYGLLGFFYRRFLEISGEERLAAVGASVIFATFHAPNGFLVAVTLVAGMMACILYRRVPNILAIGVAHGVISFALLCSLPPEVTGGLRVGPGYLAHG